MGQTPAVKEEIVPDTPFNNPVWATFGVDPGKGNSVLYVAEDQATPTVVRRILRLRNPIFERMNGDAPAKMLISEKNTPTSYPEPNFQTADAVFKVAFKLHPPAPAGKQVCFRIIDPADVSPYTNLPAQAGCTAGTPPGQACDNGDQSYDLITPQSTTGKTVCSQTDVNSQVQVNIRIAPTSANARYGGDNFRVQVSFDDFSTAPSPLVYGVSPLVTAWKRQYIQRATMFKQGGLLNFSVADPFANGNYPSSGGGCTTSNIVLDPQYSNLAGAGVVNIPIVLFDKAHPYGSAGAQSTTITRIDRPAAGSNTCGAGAILLTVNPVPNQGFGTYFAGLTGTGKGAGIGVVASGLFPSSLPVSGSFNQAYVEINQLKATQVTPYAPQALFGTCDAGVKQAFYDWNTLWNVNIQNVFFFSHVDSMGAGSVACTSAPNRYTVIQVTDVINHTTCPGAPPCPPQEATRMQFSETHEDGHENNVNNAGAAGCDQNGGHDTRCDWTNSAANCTAVSTGQVFYCVMNVQQTDLDRQNSNKFFDLQDLLFGCSAAPPASGNPETSIRRTPDPK